ncbi:MAG TPA: hypothetical protein VFT80_01875 [Actinomycetota bacterium]|nr:hypothetical protein [Actinomycetota bacterium]
MLLPLIAAVVVVVIVFFTIRDRDAEIRATILKGTGFALLALSTQFFVMFRVADTLHEHDGWAVVGAIAAWAVPMAILAAIAWLWPDVAIRVIAVLIAATIGLSIWFALDVDGWTAFEDRNGPIRDIVMFVLAAGTAVLALRRAAAAGVLLVILGAVPVAIASLGSLEDVGPAIVFAMPNVAGILFLLSANLSAGGVGAGLGPDRRPKPA